jgi:glucose/mannose-6-phosphate isomerase
MHLKQYFMSTILDSKEETMKLDSKNMAGSIQRLPDQILQIQKEVGKVKIPAGYKKVSNIVFLGMGGSALGAHCIRSIFGKEIKIPLNIVNNYSVPAFVGKKTLVVAVSYSGGTEEVLSALEKAKKAGAKIIVITSGGALAELARAYRVPALVFGTENNPCGSPRMGLGYTIFGPLAIIAKLGFVKVSNADFKKVVATVKKYDGFFGLEVPEASNAAKQFAHELLRGPVWYIGSSHLSGSIHVAANQMNENAKRFGGYFLIPELNHHLLEGLKFPGSSIGTFVFVESTLNDKRITKRFQVTKDILKQSNVPFLTFLCTEKTPLLQAMEVLVFGSYIGYYTALLGGIDPTAIPTVDYLKAALKSK